MSLIEKIREAVSKGNIKEPFTAKEIKSWMLENKIKKTSGRSYTRISGIYVLSNYDKNVKTSKNRKALDSRKNNQGKKEYWFF